MPTPSEQDLEAAIAIATRGAISALFEEYADHHFYYCALITTGEAHCPYLTAWSREALAAAAGASSDPDAERCLKWSYADSPFYCYGEHLFAPARGLFAQRPVVSPSNVNWEREYDLRLSAMERAIAKLDAEGFFGTGPARLDIVVNVEVMPPDTTNALRALRLNPRGALGDWLREAAEPGAT